MRRILLGFVLVLAMVACKKAPGGGGGGGGGDDDGSPDAPGAPGTTTYTLHITESQVPVNVDQTECVVLNLGNTQELKIHEMHNTLTAGSHHMIVYKDDMDTVEQTTPMQCQPFTGALNTTGNIAPLVITQNPNDDVKLPDGIAYTFAPNQMIKLELHSINTTEAPLDITGTVVVTAVDPATIHDEASIMFTGSLDVSVPPGMSMLHQYFTVPDGLDFSASHIFAVTGHEHQYGIGVDVNVSPAKTGPMTPVYDPTSFLWSEPPTQYGNPDFSIPVGGGLDFTCTWYNNTSATIPFGEKATDEMCFFWLYYWPSQGSKVCFHSDKYSADVCCPGDSLCSLIGGSLGN